MSREEVDEIHRAVERVCVACGVQGVREGMPRVEDIEYQEGEGERKVCLSPSVVWCEALTCGWSSCRHRQRLCRIAPQRLSSVARQKTCREQTWTCLSEGQRADPPHTERSPTQTTARRSSSVQPTKSELHICHQKRSLPNHSLSINPSLS